MSEKFELVKGIIADQLGVEAETLTEETRFVEDLETDSLDVIEIIMAFEEEFNTKINDEEIKGIKTIGDVVNLI